MQLDHAPHCAPPEVDFFCIPHKSEGSILFFRHYRNVPCQNSHLATAKTVLAVGAFNSIPDGGSPPTMDTAKKERFPGRGPGRYRGTSSARAEHTAVVDLSGPSGTADDTTTSEAVARPALSREICNLTQKSQSDTCFFQNRRTVYQPDLFQGFSRLGLCSART